MPGLGRSPALCPPVAAAGASPGIIIAAPQGHLAFFPLWLSGTLKVLLQVVHVTLIAMINLLG